MKHEAERGTEFLGVRFDDLDEEEALTAIERLSKQAGFSYVVTPNVDHVVRLHSKRAGPPLWESYQGASLCLCDSRILQRLARLSGRYINLVTGSDLTARLLDEHVSEFRSVAVIGGDTGLVDGLTRLYPSVEWLHHSPPMGLLSNPEARRAVITFVEGCPARLFLLAVGSPQSELVCAEIAGRLRARGVALCIGASLEFIVGTKRRAPPWMQRMSLEWLFRLVCEPRRLWRRYLLTGPAIFRIWLAQITGRRGPLGFDSIQTDET